MTGHGHHETHSGAACVGHERRRRDVRALRWALGLTAAYCVVEVAGGWLANSLALLSDAGHMFTDVAALGLSLFAVRLAQLPPTARKTFGYHRGEILAAFVNGLFLWLVVGLIVREAWTRLFHPTAVHSAPLLVVAGLGLVVNIVVLVLLRRSGAQSLNVRSAFVHVVGDALGSVGALVAAAVIATTGWYPADTLVSVAIALLILCSSWGIVRESVDILMQGTPRGLQLDEIEACLRGIDGVEQVHDLHVWTQTSGLYLLSAHLVVGRDGEPHAAVEAARSRLRERFGITHSTVQVDAENACPEEYRVH